MRLTKNLSIKSVLVLVLAFSVLQFGCGAGDFAANLRLTLALAPPLIDSLVDTGALPASARTGLITDFVDLSNGAADMVDSFKTCGESKPCKLDAVRKYYGWFTVVAARGHFGQHERLQKIERIIQGVLDAALIYYGGRSLSKTAAVVNPAVAKQRVENGLKELKAEMQKR